LHACPERQVRESPAALPRSGRPGPNIEATPSAPAIESAMLIVGVDDETAAPLSWSLELGEAGMRQLIAAVVLSIGTLEAHGAAAETVDLELVLLADASRSIDDAEIRFQRQGYAAAITHPEVLGAIAQGFEQRIAVTYVEWGEASSQEVVVPGRWSTAPRALPPSPRPCSKRRGARSGLTPSATRSPWLMR
jgi:hypothetical protein